MTEGNTDFRALEERQNLAFARGDFVALEAAAREIAAAFPDQSDDAAMTVAIARVQRGDHAGAVRELEESLDRGLWWPPQWFEMYGNFLGPLQGLPEFDRVRKRAGELQARAEGETRRPSHLLVMPSIPKSPPDRPPPWLIVLHGRGQNARAAEPIWGRAAEEGFRVALVQSSQPWSSQRYRWDDVPRALDDLRSVTLDLPRESPNVPLVLAGYSQGAALAVHATLQQTLPAIGFLAVAPTRAVALEGGETLVDLAARPLSPDLKGVLVTGTADPSRGATETLQDKLVDGGVDCRLDLVPGLGHDYPPDFAARLPTLLRQLLK
ncbi:MAG: alpha/beta hydrolase [Euryarchaeota archaeon]|nr:alpha/beta hydrolase [Euryarchaeota archaeon]MDE1835560.1 alpha/beta hydrolase [Euryarchaeota archaeon]MDE1878908.1 alpha/beta hydrolase [Euryarchaeota archaeon]MDE2043818.1 alpha/beta hydrolase [Thermoplasmata archaeon]